MHFCIILYNGRKPKSVMFFFHNLSFSLVQSFLYDQVHGSSISLALIIAKLVSGNKNCEPEIGSLVQGCIQGGWGNGPPPPPDARLQRGKPPYQAYVVFTTTHFIALMLWSVIRP